MGKEPRGVVICTLSSIYVVLHLWRLRLCYGISFQVWNVSSDVNKVPNWLTSHPLDINNFPALEEEYHNVLWILDFM